jgi:hypothetical protein
MLMILGGEDELLDSDDFTAMEQAAQRRNAPTEVITADNATHLMAIHVDPEGYAARIGKFLGQSLNKPSVPHYV